MSIMNREEDVDAAAVEQPSTATQVIAATVAAGAGLVVSGPAGAVVGAALQPALAEALHRAGAEIAEWRRASTAQVLEVASNQLGRSPDQLIDAASRSPESAQLLAETLLAAARTLNKQKIHALARALANGLRNDQARPDEEHLIVAALADVEEPHIKVLTHLGPERSRSRTSTSNVRSRTAPSARGQRAAHIAEVCQLSVGAARAVLSVLQRAGMAVEDAGSETVRVDRLIIELQQELNKVTALIIDPPKSGKILSSKRPSTVKPPGTPAATGWTITPFGELCLAYLSDVEIELATSDGVNLSGPVESESS